MVETHRLLVVGPDAGLLSELRAAAGPLDDLQIALEHEREAERGVGRAGDRNHSVAVLDDRLGADALLRTARGLQESDYDGQVVVAFRPDVDGLAEGSSAWLDLLRAGVRDFLRRPVSSADLGRLLGNARAGSGSTGERVGRGSGRIAMFTSNKGGVGKSTLAVNVAAQLARSAPERVLLVDASLQIGSCASLLDLNDDVCLTDVLRERERLDTTLLRSLARVHESGLHLLPAPRDAVEAAEVDEGALARMFAVARRAYDWIIVDTFPMLDGVAMATLDLSDRVFVVTSGAVPTAQGVAQYLALLGRLGVPSERIRVVWNRSRPRFSGSLKRGDLEQALGHSADYVVPFSKRFMIGADQGSPPVLGAGWSSRSRRSIATIARSLREDFSAEPVG